MLLIILLAVITKLAVVTADCNISTANVNHTLWTKLTGTWYWMYHIPQKYNDDVDCSVSTFELITNHFGAITTSVYVKSAQTRHRISGTVHWNADGFVDFYYSEPTPDAKCAANETCVRKPGYASLWNGKYRALSAHPERYVIFEYCCQHLNTICFYVAFRTPNPEAESLDEVKKELKRNGLDFNRLVKWENKHC